MDRILDWLPASVLVGLFAAALRWMRPRRLISYLAAVKEREAWMAHAEYEKQAGLRWMHQAQECRDELTRLDSELTRLRAASRAGGGSTS